MTQAFDTVTEVLLRILSPWDVGSDESALITKALA